MKKYFVHTFDKKFTVEADRMVYETSGTISFDKFTGDNRSECILIIHDAEFAYQEGVTLTMKPLPDEYDIILSQEN